VLVPGLDLNVMYFKMKRHRTF